MANKLATDSTLQELLNLLKQFTNTQQSTLAGNIGTLANLSTTAKDSLVAAINEVSGTANTASGDIGTIASLLTTAKGNLVAAVNELHSLAYNHTISNNAYAHRCIYRGKNLGSTITDEQSAAIRNGTFTDIFIGDYWWHSWRGKTTTFLIVDIDYYLNNLPWWKFSGTDYDVGRHHVVVMTLGSHIKDGGHWVENAPYKADGDYSGGYYNSDVRNNTIPVLTEEFAAIFGEEHMLYHPDYICNAVNDNGDAGYILVNNSCVEVPSWRMIANRTNTMPAHPNFQYPGTPHVPGRFAAFRVLPFSKIYTTPGGTYFRECRNTSHICVAGYNEIGYMASRSFFRPYFTLY